jgi:hypothetical protein
MDKLLTLCPILLLLLSAAASPSGAEVVVNLHHRPLVADHLAARTSADTPTASAPATHSLTTARGNVPVGGFWFVPRYEVDTTSFSDTTLWSARNESAVAVDLTAQYYNTLFELQHTQTISLAPAETAPVNVRDIGGLPVDPDGFARGFIRLSPANGPISVDVFQVDASENFASADQAFVTADFCANWQTRFLSFGPGQGSVVSFLVNGPRGSAAGDPATVLGDVYNEQGSFINSFTIRTDNWVFDVAILDVVLGGVSFGSVEVVIDSVFAPEGFLTVAHSAEDRYSVGLRGVCRDGI